MKIQVSSYAGHQAEVLPRSFCFGKRDILVQEIIDRWIAPEYRYFKVRGDDDGIYILRYDVVNEYWELTMFNRGDFASTRLSST
ncbi:MAG: hypothetical protein PVF34_11175 [Gammaproteobacteria bacterium]